MSALQRRVELVLVLALKEWRIRYRSAKLGYAWAVVQPVLLMVVLLTLFNSVAPVDVEKHPESLPRALFLLTGLFPWHFSSVSLSSGTPTFPNSMKLVKLAAFPRDVLPDGVVAAHLINLLLTLPLLTPLYVWYRTPPNVWILALPLVVALHWMLQRGLVQVAALTNVRFTDTFFLVQALMLPWLLATPIYYPRRALGSAADWLWLNPLTGVMELYRACLMPGWPVEIVGATGLAAVITVAWVAALCGLAEFLRRRMEPTLADWL